MAGDGPTYPVGVISFAPANQSYTVDAALYEALLRNNGKVANEAARFRALLVRVVHAGEHDMHQLRKEIEEALSGRATTV